ncbi:MAG TPA: SAM-dependent methyltransferase [Verrucomicrobiae bacterium]|nr:SAM-dependent methyltransferase [Verrucomicrobiae bacterium]
MDLLLCAEDSEAELCAELESALPGAAVEWKLPRLVAMDLALSPGKTVPYLAFARQFFPEAEAVKATSIRAWATRLFDRINSCIRQDEPWLLHIAPYYGAPSSHRIGARAWHTHSRHAQAARIGGHQPAGPAPGAGRQRCQLIREILLELLERKRRGLLRHVQPDVAPFSCTTSLVQLLLTGPEDGFISMARAPLPFKQRHVLSPFPLGELPVAIDKSAPSRAFAKLVEAEARLGQSIRAGETCVDLGAAPGSWTYVAAKRGAWVTAIDRAELRLDLMRHERVKVRTGDALGFVPDGRVDWMLCDIIAEPERTAELVVRWVSRGWCRRWVVTLKLREAAGLETLEWLKKELPQWSSELLLTRLCANKKEVCVSGVAKWGLHPACT